MAFKLHTLGMASVSTVIVGRENWLFIGHETERVDELRYFLGCNPLGEAALEQWLQVLTERQRWLEQRGIGYLLVIAPNKSTVYPENYARDLSPRPADPVGPAVQNSWNGALPAFLCSTCVQS